jgi:hypothetical protein
VEIAERNAPEKVSQKVSTEKPMLAVFWSIAGHWLRNGYWVMARLTACTFMKLSFPAYPVSFFLIRSPGANKECISIWRPPDLTIEKGQSNVPTITSSKGCAIHHIHRIWFNQLNTTAAGIIISSLQEFDDIYDFTGND